MLLIFLNLQVSKYYLQLKIFLTDVELILKSVNMWCVLVIVRRVYYRCVSGYLQ